MRSEFRGRSQTPRDPSVARRLAARGTHTGSRQVLIVSVCWRCPGGVERSQFRLAYRP
jgi:hypothetical protein